MVVGLRCFILCALLIVLLVCAYWLFDDGCCHVIVCYCALDLRVGSS